MLSLKPIVASTMRSQRHKSRGIICKSFPFPNSKEVKDATRQTLSAAYEPLIDLLEKIDKKLESIDKKLENGYVMKTDGSFIEMKSPEEAKKSALEDK